MSVLLIHPPVVKPSEPPAGLAKLAGALSSHGIPYVMLDANIEGILSLIDNAPSGADRWTQRAGRNSARNLAGIKDRSLYDSFAGYRRVVGEICRLLDVSAAPYSVKMSVADYRYRKGSPVKSRDLLFAAEHPEENPFHKYFEKRLGGLLQGEDCSMAGLSLNYLSQALTAFAMIGFIKKRFPSLKIVLGGGLITSWMKSAAWRNPFSGLVDHCVAGPGEAPLLSLLGREPQGNVHYQPDFRGFSVDDYMAPGFVLPYAASTGCYWGRCSFCPERAEGNRYTQVSPHAVTAELNRIVSDTKPVLIHLVDNAISPAVLRALVKDRPGVPWYGFVRVTDDLLDPDFCSALRRSGCAMLKLGIESGDQGVLDAMQKGVGLSQVSRVLKSLAKAGIATYAYLLFGTPYEAEREARATLNFVAKHSQYITFMNVAIFNLPVNSPDSRGLELKTFYEGDLSLYTDFVHPKGWDRRTARAFLDREFKKDPAIRQVIQRQPPFFTSNHAAFFCLMGLTSPPLRA
ncbi:MAG: radical SAM protein [Syntrophorhabdaceae bacterium]|nr:radical SAM protein [Syntrophorhabdaceae bacterium]